MRRGHRDMWGGKLIENLIIAKTILRGKPRPGGGRGHSPGSNKAREPLFPRVPYHQSTESRVRRGAAEPPVGIHRARSSEVDLQSVGRSLVYTARLSPRASCIHNHDYCSPYEAYSSRETCLGIRTCGAGPRPPLAELLLRNALRDVQSPCEHGVWCTCAEPRSRLPATQYEWPRHWDLVRASASDEA